MSEILNNLKKEYKLKKKEMTSKEEKQKAIHDYKGMKTLIKDADKLLREHDKELKKFDKFWNKFDFPDFPSSDNCDEISLVVSNMIPDKVYDVIANLEVISLNFGEIEFFSKNEIDNAQRGFRFNANTNQIISDWFGNEYIVIGYDCTAGFGPDPLIIKIDNPNYPIYWLMAEGGKCENFIKVADSLDIFATAYKKLLDHKSSLESNSLNIEESNSLIHEIKNIVNSSNISWWENVIMSACKSELNAIADE